MRCAVSNIAWQPEERRKAYDVLSAHGIEGLEIAPGLFFYREPDPIGPSAAALAEALGDVTAAGLRLVSMQSLLFGVEGAALFGSGEAANRFEKSIARAIDLAERLAIANLVLGSPKQRVIPKGIGRSRAEDVACDVLRRLGERAAAAGTTIAVEPNPAAYGTNFLTSFRETLAFVIAVSHPAVRLNLDIGALHMTGEFGQIETIAEAARPVCSHVHLSEPYLAPAPARINDAVRVVAALEAAGIDCWLSLEMRQVADGDLSALDSALARLGKAVKAAEAGVTP